ncbi:LAGLIDADG family homing endonuclease, partial [Candidatus Pacearchaeota archaeon]|nr:LAGLIDADG family homing endonuclease [Candidatus Pacearchaeota archaeon]
KDEILLHKIKDYFGFGSVQINRTDKNGTRKEFRVRGLGNLNKIVDFFKINNLRTSKRKDFEIFSEVIKLMNNQRHLTKDGLDEIAQLISNMNRKPNLRYLESPENIR